MKVVFSAQAKAELIAIGDHIAKDSPRRAFAFVEKLETKALETGEMPRKFPLLPRYQHSGIRRRPVLDYLIFYRIEDDQVSILHILYSAQDYEPLLFPEA